jgi:hypothetical protein
MKKPITCGACGSVNQVEPNADFTELKVIDVEISAKLKAMAGDPAKPDPANPDPAPAGDKDSSWLAKIFRKEA